MACPASPPCTGPGFRPHRALPRRPDGAASREVLRGAAVVLGPCRLAPRRVGRPRSPPPSGAFGPAAEGALTTLP
eukprot:5184357-Alexandrium_andersonii.AAC.1